MCRKPAIAALVGLLALGATPLPTALADDFRLIPTAFLSEEFNDNILFSSTGSRSSFITTLSGGFDLVDNTERLSTRLKVRLDGLLYSEESSLNALEQRYRAQAGYLLTPLLRLAGSAAFSRESRPDRLIESTGLVVRQESSHQSYSLTGDATFTEKTTGQLSYAYNRVDYHDSTVSDFEAHSVRGVVGYDMGGVVPLMKLRSIAGADINRYTSATLTTSSLTVGVSYPFHELWGVQGDLGGRLTHSEFSSETGGGGLTGHSSDNAGLVANLMASYHNETDTAALSLSRDIQNAAGRSGSVQATAVTLQLTRRFSYELAASLGAGYYLNFSERGEFSSQPIDYSTVRFSPALRYAFTRDLALDLSYEFAMVDNHQARSETRRNKVFICLTLEKPLFE